MNKKQALRAALIAEASAILAGNPMDCISENLSTPDMELFENARRDIAKGMLRRAGVETVMSADEILSDICKVFAQ